MLSEQHLPFIYYLLCVFPSLFLPSNLMPPLSHHLSVVLLFDVVLIIVDDRVHCFSHYDTCLLRVLLTLKDLHSDVLFLLSRLPATHPLFTPHLGQSY